MSGIYKWFFILMLSLSPLWHLMAGNSLNQKNVIMADFVDSYSFFVSGHFHGSSKNTTGMPAATLLENIGRINSAEVSFLVSLGDLFMDIKNDIPAYRKHFLDKLTMPLFNVPGNHDKSGDIYEKNFGQTFYFFRLKSEVYIFLDTELDDGNISGAQLALLKDALNNLKGVKNIFIFSHRLIWAEEHPDMKHLFADNTRSGSGNNFRTDVLPLLKKTGRNIFLMGGSLGNAPSPFFYHKENKITYIATAIRDTPKDAFLQVNINNGRVELSAFPLVMPVQYYNLDFYNKQQQPEAGFNWRLIPLYIKKMVFHRYFWYGILVLGIPVLSLYLYRKFRKRKK